MRIIDVSMPIHRQMPVYKNREAKRPSFTPVMSMPGDSINESAVCMNLHTGTHVDAPRHMIREGAGAEALPLRRLITPCRVLDLTGIEGGITRGDLEGLGILPGSFVLLRTDNSYKGASREDFVYLEAGGAAYLAELPVSGVGIDSLGIERDQPGHESHLALLSRDIIILEGLALENAAAGEYFMIALPLSLPGADGAPARVILLEGEGPLPGLLGYEAS